MPRARSTPLVLAQQGELSVERDPDRPSGRLLIQNGMEASYVDLADPTHLEFEYMRWIRSVLRIARARRVLHIGGAACALARALAIEDPSTRQEVCEADRDVLEFARRHLGLRRTPGLRVRHVEGRQHLARQPDGAFDAIVVDAFVAARIPRHLVSEAALSEAARVAPLTLVNVVDDRTSRETYRVDEAMAAAYPCTWRFGIRPGNTIVAGDALGLDLDRIAAALAADAAPAARL
jgi:hypothetical protein